MTTLEIMQLLTIATEQWKNVSLEAPHYYMKEAMGNQEEIIKKLQQLLLNNLNNDERAR